MTAKPLDLAQLIANEHHYRAPWKIAFSDGSGPNYVTDSMDNAVCTMGFTGNPECGQELEDGEAEQQILIVAAPALLAEVRELRAALRAQFDIKEEVLNMVNDYLPPDGISQADALTKIIGILDCGKQRAADALAAPWLAAEGEERSGG